MAEAQARGMRPDDETAPRWCSIQGASHGPAADPTGRPPSDHAPARQRTEFDLAPLHHGDPAARGAHHVPAALAILADLLVTR